MAASRTCRLARIHLPAGIGEIGCHRSIKLGLRARDSAFCHPKSHVPGQIAGKVVHLVVHPAQKRAFMIITGRERKQGSTHWLPYRCRHVATGSLVYK